MLELGKGSKKAHEETGKLIAGLNIDAVIGVGKETENIIKSINKVEREITTKFFKNKITLLDSIKDLIHPDDIVLLKASRGMKFEE